MSSASADVPKRRCQCVSRQAHPYWRRKGHFVAVTPISSDDAWSSTATAGLYQQRLVGMVATATSGITSLSIHACPSEAAREGTDFLIFDGKQHRVECDKRVTNQIPSLEARCKRPC